MDYFTRSSALGMAFLFSTLFSSSAFAYDGHFYAGAEVGKSFATVGHGDPSITYYNDYLTDYYPVNNAHASTGVTALKGGYEFLGVGSWKKPALSVGLGLYNTPATYRYQGQLVETPLGGTSSTLYNYQYRLH